MLKKIFFQENSFYLKLFLDFSFKTDNITLDPDSNWVKNQDPDQNSMYLDQLHWFEGGRSYLGVDGPDVLEPDELVEELVLLSGEAHLEQRLLGQRLRVAQLQRKLHLAETNQNVNNLR